MNFFALLISIIFEPLVVLYALSLLVGFGSLRGGNSLFYYVFSVTIFAIGVILTRLYIQSKSNTNWDVSDRKKRIWPLSILLGVMLGQYYLVTMLKSAPILSLYWLFVIWLIGFLIFTLKIKLSGHVSVLTLAIFQIIAWYGLSLFPLLFFIPLLGWSRVYLKRHTVKEVVYGVCYSMIIVLWLN